MTQNRLETLKKVILFFVAVVLLLAVVTVVLLYKPAPGEASNINIEQYWTNENKEYIGEFGFDYRAEQVETQRFPVLLGAESRIVVKELDPESSPCRLSLYSGSEKLWWTPIEAGAEYRPDVVLPGAYDLVLEMANGTGKVYVVIEN